MNLYLDASVLVPLFVSEARSDDAQAGLQGRALFISDLAAAEFSAAISRRVRTGDLGVEQAPAAFATFDAWSARAANRVPLETGDLLSTIALVRRLDLHLRTADAVNLAIVQRLGAEIFTFDKKMAEAARSLGLAVQS